MNESTIDNLFAVVPPVPDAASAAGSRTRDDSGEFGDRLRQAAAPPAEPWWRASPNRSESNRRPPSNSPPSPPAPANHAPKPATDPSPSASSDSTKTSDRRSRRGDDPPARDSDSLSSAATPAATAAPVTAKHADDGNSSDDKSINEQPPAETIESAAELKDNATPAPSLTTIEKDSLPAIDGKTVTTAKYVAPAQQELPATIQQTASPPVDSTPPTTSTKPQPPVEDATTVSTSAIVAAAANDQAALAPTQQTPPASATDPPPVVDLHADKKSDAKATSSHKETAKPNDVSHAPVNRLAAVQTNENGAQPSAAAVVQSTAKDQKPPTNPDSSPTDGKAAVDQPKQPAPAPASTNQPAPVVAAVTTMVAVEQAVADNGSAASAQKTTRPAGPPNSSTLAAFGRIDRGTGSLTASGPRQPGDGADMPTIDPTRFISRVAKAIETAQDRGGPLNLRLNPPELGSMRIELDVKQGVMTAKVETDTAAARQALLDNLPTLRARLAEHNVRIDRFDVDVRRDGTGDQATPGKQHHQYQQQFSQAPPARTTSTTPRTDESAPAEPAPLDRIITNTTINLVA